MSKEGPWRWWRYETPDYKADNKCLDDLVPSIEVVALLALAGPFLLKRRILLGLVERSEPRPAGIDYVVDVLWSIKEDTSLNLFIRESCTGHDYDCCCETIVSREGLAQRLRSLFGRDDYAVIYSTWRGPGTRMELVAGARMAPLIVQDVDGDLVQLIIMDAAYVQRVVSALDVYAKRTAHHA